MVLALVLRDRLIFRFGIPGYLTHEIELLNP